MHIVVTSVDNPLDATGFIQLEEAVYAVEDMKKFIQNGFGDQNGESDFMYHNGIQMPKNVLGIQASLSKVEGVV
ncbi:hypothetical protein [Rossellomorea marisflavi]|uniref:hypothetical protein n=1 Tax=Rossellomorea marisflavi TaxID=189381 RepID=UPI003FA08F0E